MSGDHLEWAITPERVLSERIEAARAAVDASSSTRKRDATSSFFGELDALGEANSRPNTAPPPAAEPSSPYDSVPAGLPTGGSAAKWWGLAVVAAVLVVGLLWSLL
jgi:hypothetical protein